ncbi:MAG: tRNA dihydrouridine(20/20a) synthase DusA [Gammaproteobacteria bacterium]|nr:tRNA dihydrouridine(20/20a) synthase DusA [Gammaproteobacteria bacterium]
MRDSSAVISVAPMMDWTDRHCRFFMRLLSPSARLYTEMVTAAAIVHGDAERFLRYNKEEHPLALQLGGSDPDWMAKATARASEFAYDEININVGCPSDRVQSGQFGACLMARPDVVASCFRAMQQETDAPVTVKTRIGIDDKDDYDFLQAFVEELVTAGCRKFVVHARIAILEGLSPKENRSVPPLNYARVFRLKRDFPELEIVINGGLTEVGLVDEVLQHVDGAMIGRQAYHQPYFLAELERHFRPDWHMPSRQDVVEEMLPYVDRMVADGASLNSVSRHMLGLFAGQPGARAWRRYISEHAHREGAGSEVLVNALNAMPAAA